MAYFQQKNDIIEQKSEQQSTNVNVKDKQNMKKKEKEVHVLIKGKECQCGCGDVFDDWKPTWKCHLCQYNQSDRKWIYRGTKAGSGFALVCSDCSYMMSGYFLE